MFWQVEIKDKENIFDSIGDSVKKDILDLGIKGVEKVSFVQVYFLEGDILQQDITVICRELLADSITQDYNIITSNQPQEETDPKEFVVEVAYNPGVMDPVEESTLKGIKDLNIDSVIRVRTAKKYILRGVLDKEALDFICEKLLYNKLIQHIVPSKTAISGSEQKDNNYTFKLKTINLIASSDKGLEAISRDGQLFLNLDEMRSIKKYFVRLKRDPTDCELETVAQTWSEHCAHKTFRGRIDYSEVKGNKVVYKKKIRGLLKSTIMKVTDELKKSWCVSVFKDNSGVIRFDEKHNVCFKVETHNHPSALEPFGGANTGIGGVIRDPLGTGLGAKPIFNTDVFCFAHPDYPLNELPKGLLHPKRVMKGVVSGVRDYGNKMGIPTVNGAVLFHERFLGNPLVYCGTAGIMPKDKTFKKIKSGSFIVVVGGATGRDGIHGATFSSGDLTHESEKISSGAVQIGNPIQEKKTMEAILLAQKEGLFSAITDCGAGGLSSAVGEMAEDTGARVDLEKVPLKYKGLSYDEIWISESQERMVLCVEKKNLKRLKEVFDSEDVEAAVIGEFTDTKRLKLYYNKQIVCDLDMDFLHKGRPDLEKKAVFTYVKQSKIDFHQPKDLNRYLFKLLSSYDICSKEWIIRQYDHEVQGGSVIKPLVGVKNDGPSDASVVRPFLDSKKGIAVSNGINFYFGMVDPFWMAASCIDEALRQIVSVGGSIEKIAILDNFCWGNPDKADRLGSLVRASLGCYRIAKDYGVPFISGKDSLYNEFISHGRSIAIPGTLLISAIGVIADVEKTITMDFKRTGNPIYIVGETFDELGASCYSNLMESRSGALPKVNALKSKILYERLHLAINKGLVKSCHDCSDGGLAVSISEMAFASDMGAEVYLKNVPYRALNQKDLKNREDCVLFSESNSRFIVEIPQDCEQEFNLLMGNCMINKIGRVNSSGRLKIIGFKNNPIIDAGINDLKESWQKTLRW